MSEKMTDRIDKVDININDIAKEIEKRVTLERDIESLRGFILSKGENKYIVESSNHSLNHIYHILNRNKDVLKQMKR